MTTSVEGIYENGAVRLLQPLPGIEKARVRITVLSDAVVSIPASETDNLPSSAAHHTAEHECTTGDAVVDHYRPRTELGRRLIERRRAYVQAGGKLSSWEEIDAEVRDRRGGAVDD